MTQSSTTGPSGAPAFTDRAFRDALGTFATGVCVVTTRSAGAPGGFVGLTVNSFTSVSLDPPLVLWCLGKDSDRAGVFLNTDSFAVSVLAADQEDLSRAFAGDDEAGAGTGSVPTRTGVTGTPMLEGALAQIDCMVEARHDGGDHIILVGRVAELASKASGQPLLYFRGDYGTLAS